MHQNQWSKNESDQLLSPCLRWFGNLCATSVVTDVIYFVILCRRSFEPKNSTPNLTANRRHWGGRINNLELSELQTVLKIWKNGTIQSILSNRSDSFPLKKKPKTLIRYNVWGNQSDFPILHFLWILYYSAWLLKGGGGGV